MQKAKNTYLSLGSNQGNTLQNLQLAINAIASKIGDVTQISSVYKTQSWGFESDDFLNICVEISTLFNAETILFKIEEIETFLGRKKPTLDGYEARPIDIDILLFENEEITAKNLIIPHPEMLKRKFVLVPLAEIAPKLVHPKTSTSIEHCLENCTDASNLEKTSFKLYKPMLLTEKFNYIAIEGNIGAGKTSLANKISDDFNAKIVLERFADNPFLPKYYADMERYAFPLEMSFLADRYQQLTDDLGQFDLFKNFIVSDYYIFKSLIFAHVSLAKEEYHLYRRMFDIMYNEIQKPDLYIYLYQNTPGLLANIKKRGREYEQNIESEYLDNIHKGYVNFIKTEKNLNTLIIDVTDKDFVNNPEDYQTIINLIKSS
ncbi:MAG TPA: 2-amino-4-hydroxy-6-hydroxymethyldihydropteridine diphosphokinase [Flavobacteriaceae bacterium]|nr:2-amino-4-hydroxy-6-hydroxymethyldihydropteridine diphosphokinase [Flavobacteriaceae bacterium]